MVLKTLESLKTFSESEVNTDGLFVDFSTPPVSLASDIGEKIERNISWILRESKQPFKIGKLLKVRIKTDSYGFENDSELQQILLSAKEEALHFLLEFYNKKYVELQFNNFLPHVNAAEWYLEPTPNSKISVLVVTNEELFNEVFPVAKIPFVDNEAIYDYISIELWDFREQFERIEKFLLKLERIVSKLRFEKQIRIANFSFKLQIKSLQRLQRMIINLLDVNNLEIYNKNEFIVFGIDDKYNIINIFFQNSETRYQLVIGDKNFVNSPIAKKAQLISMIYNIFKSLNDFEEVDWITFFLENIFPNPLIDFNGVNPNTLRAAGRVHQAADEYIDVSLESSGESCFLYNPPPDYRADLLREYESIKTSIQKLLSAKLGVVVEFNADEIFKDLASLINKINSLPEILVNVISKIDLQQLLEDLMSCIPGICINLNIPWPKIPKLPKIPTIDFIFFIQIAIETGILKLILKMLKSLISLIVLSLPRFCQDGSTFNLPEDFGSVDMNDLPVNTPYPFDAPNHAKSPNCSEEMIKEFVEDVSNSLTPSQLCLLLHGETTAIITEVVMNILEQDKFSCLKDKFGEEGWLEFFESFGMVIGNQILDNLCRTAEGTSVLNNKTFDCSFEEGLKKAQESVYKLKTNIPENYIQSQIEINEGLKQNIINVLDEVANADLKSEFGNFIDATPIQSENDNLITRTIKSLLEPAITKVQQDFYNLNNYISNRFKDFSVLLETPVLMSDNIEYNSANAPFIPKDNIVSYLFHIDWAGLYNDIELNVNDFIDFEYDKNALVKKQNSLTFKDMNSAGQDIEGNMREIIIKASIQLRNFIQNWLKIPLYKVYGTHALTEEEELNSDYMRIYNKLSESYDFQTPDLQEMFKIDSISDIQTYSDIIKEISTYIGDDFKKVLKIDPMKGSLEKVNSIRKVI